MSTIWAHKLRRHAILAAACATVLLCVLAQPGQSAPLDVQALLNRPILGFEQVRAEVQAYATRRVPSLPVATTVEQWDRYADKLRRLVLENIVFRGDAVVWRDAPAQVQWLDTIGGGEGYCIKKLRYEALPGLWIPALLYEPQPLTGPVPAILNVNGHTSDGKSIAYKQIRCINLAKRGMRALNLEWIGMGQLESKDFRHSRSNQLDLCGTSGLSVFYLAMQRGLDILLDLEGTDPHRVGMTGLSGGGWQTIILSALDTRVKLCDPVAGYASFRTRLAHPSDIGDSEQAPDDLGTVADYTHLTALLAPRPALLTYNDKDDCCFQSAYALPPLLDAARTVYALYGQPQNLRHHVNSQPGTHNYEQDNREAFYRLVGDHFFRGTAYDAKEIACEAELKTTDELFVPLPGDNANFNALALELSGPLPRGSLPADAASLASWQERERGELREIVRARSCDVVPELAGSIQLGTVSVLFWRLKTADDWTVPAVEFASDAPGQTVLVVNDQGRSASSEHVTRQLSENKRVVAIDLFGFGEAAVENHQGRFALMLSTLGERQLGIDASQINAVARWMVSERDTGPVTVSATGPRSSLICLVAAALEPEAIGQLELAQSMGSLKEIIEQNLGQGDVPEQFCFGLLAAFDIAHLAALAAPRELRIKAPSQRLRDQLAPLIPWYTALQGVSNASSP